MPANTELFKKYPNPVFIETGSHKGDGIQRSLNAGFELIYSIEIIPEYYELCVNRFKGVTNVNIMLGDSRTVLKELLPIIRQPITFWLDAHLCVPSDITAILEEIEVIKQHGIKTHTILIDDLRDWNIVSCGFDVDTLKDRLKQINPNYAFKLEDGHVPNDILVAVIE